MKNVSKENKEEIMAIIKKAGDPENYKTTWDERGIPVSKDKIKIVQGKKSKAKGSAFELKVRKDLEGKGRIIDKWTNNLDLELGKIVPSKKIFNPFKKIMVPGAGFPDFISIKHVHGELYSIIGVECKTNGILSKIEKEKCAWYIKNKTFSQIWIAKGVREGRRIIVKYDDFQEKYGKKFGLEHNNF